jgi:hypothetical protein
MKKQTMDEELHQTENTRFLKSKVQDGTNVEPESSRMEHVSPQRIPHVQDGVQSSRRRLFVVWSPKLSSMGKKKPVPDFRERLE